MTPRLTRFVLASAALHGAVLLIAASPAAWLAGQAEMVLSVNLRASDDGARASPARPEERPRAGVTRDRARARAPRPEAASPAGDGTSASPAEPEPTVAPDSRAPASVPEGASAAASAGDTGLEQVRAQALAHLRTRLAHRFEYPYVARLRGWEGTVRLAFRLETDGRIEAIRLAHSSGFAALDAAALHSLERVERLPQATAWLQGRALDVELPVIYRLVEAR